MFLASLTKRSSFFSLFISLLFGLILTGCAIAPLNNGLTARGLEGGKLQIDSQFSSYTDKAGDLVIAPALRALYGVTSRWTVGLQTELKTFTFQTRFSILNSEKEDGLSVAPLGAIVLMGNQFSYYLGLIASYLVSGFEPYITYRYNVVTFDPTQVDPSLFQNIPPFRFDFSSIYVGLKYWITPDLATGGEWIFLVDANLVSFAVKNLLSLQFTFIL
jgi:hypothetical protein